jgi:hypothetical protein
VYKCYKRNQPTGQVYFRESATRTLRQNREQGVVQ